MNKKQFFKTLGKNIKQVRKSMNISLEELSKVTGIRKNYLIKIEKGNAPGFTTTKFLTIKAALNSNFDILFKNL